LKRQGTIFIVHALACLLSPRVSARSEKILLCGGVWNVTVILGHFGTVRAIWELEILPPSNSKNDKKWKSSYRRGFAYTWHSGHRVTRHNVERRRLSLLCWSFSLLPHYTGILSYLRLFLVFVKRIMEHNEAFWAGIEEKRSDSLQVFLKTRNRDKHLLVCHAAMNNRDATGIDAF